MSGLGDRCHATSRADCLNFSLRIRVSKGDCPTSSITARFLLPPGPVAWHRAQQPILCVLGAQPFARRRRFAAETMDSLRELAVGYGPTILEDRPVG